MTRRERLDAILDEARKQDEAWLAVNQLAARLPDEPIAVPSNDLEQIAPPPAAPTAPITYGIRG